MLHNRSQTYQSPLKPLHRDPQVSSGSCRHRYPPRLARMLCFDAVDCVEVVLRLHIFFFFIPPPPLLLLFLLSGLVKVDLSLNLHLADGVPSSVCTKKKTRTFLVHCIVAAWGREGGPAGERHDPPTTTPPCQVPSSFKKNTTTTTKKLL